MATLDKEKNELLAAILIDINELQLLNESYGHKLGDEAIISLSNILLEHINKDSIIARFSTGQFCILYKNRLYAEIYQTFNEIQDIIKIHSFEINNMKYSFTAIIRTNIDLSDNLVNMINLADEALENVKFKGTTELLIILKSYVNYVKIM
jgi:diguanylate cyclase (GGDEF)-like protein